MSETKKENEKSYTDRLIASLPPVDWFEVKAQEMGLLNVWAYHCNRCNYIWLPKDFKPINQWRKFPPGQKEYGQDLIFTELPKACARCKSRYWNQPRLRNTKNLKEVRDYMTMPEARALHRSGKADFIVPYCRCQYCRALKSKSLSKG